MGINKKFLKILDGINLLLITCICGYLSAKFFEQGTNFWNFIIPFVGSFIVCNWQCQDINNHEQFEIANYLHIAFFVFSFGLFTII